MGWQDQGEYRIRLEWGEQGLRALAPSSDVIILVDVLSFCTTVTVAVERGAVILPYSSKDASAEAFAAHHGAQLAGKRGEAKYSLSPVSMLQVSAGERVVLPGPNGAALAVLAGELAPGAKVLAGCLRNATAVAQLAQREGFTAAGALARRVSVIACGERWPDGSLRPALEDWIGAGVIMGRLHGNKSPEARAAEASGPYSEGELRDWVSGCGSARQLIEGGFREDVRLAFQTDYAKAVGVMVGREMVGA